MMRSDHSTTLGDARMLLTTAEGPRWFGFSSPIDLCRAEQLEDVEGALRQVEQLTDRGFHAVGFVAYEAASAFDHALETHPPANGLPLVWFAIYRDRSRLAERPLARRDAEHHWQPMLSSALHGRRVGQIRDAIGRGETYQVNLTFPFATEGIQFPDRLFSGLLDRQPVPHAGYLDAGRWAICSASPELFFRLDGEAIVTRPMKGTAARSNDPSVDRRRREDLAASPKDRAENLMIVDMLRNDLGRVATPGSVVVRDLHRIERYTTVWQMTSTVEARTEAGLVDLFRALFPCASITGAPKASAMRIIRQLEEQPRGIYTGALGWVGPRRRAEFNVAIRTALVDRETGRATYGVGGGIVWDSQIEAEYSEALVKAKALNGPGRFQLLESLLWRPGRGYWLRRLHLERLLTSAEVLGFAKPGRETLVAALDEVARGLPRHRHKLRLMLGSDGSVSVEALPLARAKRRWRVGLAQEPVDSTNSLLGHKTTDRSLYDRHRNQAPDGWDDVLLWNENGELTETTIANLVLECNGVRKTPAAQAGLLPGVYRQHLLRRGEIVEARLDRSDLARADRIWLINSVRGWVAVDWASV